MKTTTHKTPRQLLEPLKKNKKVPVQLGSKPQVSLSMDPIDDSPVTVGNKKTKSTEFKDLGKVDLKRSKIVINLTPRVHPNDRLDCDQEGDGISYSHFRLNDQGLWVKEKVIHSPLKTKPNQFNPANHQGFVSNEDPRNGFINRYFVQWSQQTPVKEDLYLEGVEIDAESVVSFIAGTNPFYPDNGSSRLVESLSEFDLSPLDNQTLINSVDGVRRRLVEGSYPFDGMLALLEEIRFLSHGLLDVSVGLKIDGVLRSILR